MCVQKQARRQPTLTTRGRTDEGERGGPTRVWRAAISQPSNNHMNDGDRRNAQLAAGVNDAEVMYHNAELERIENLDVYVHEEPTYTTYRT